MSIIKKSFMILCMLLYCACVVELWMFLCVCFYFCVYVCVCDRVWEHVMLCLITHPLFSLTSIKKKNIDIMKSLIWCTKIIFQTCCAVFSTCMTERVESRQRTVVSKFIAKLWLFYCNCKVNIDLFIFVLSFLYL